MILLDTNIFIYIAAGKLERQVVASYDIAHASIAIIEALGFPDIQANEHLILKSLFEESYSIALSDSIIERAIMLRQLKKMSLGDVIVAATALENDLALWTANIKDFQHIEGLTLIDPTRQQ